MGLVYTFTLGGASSFYELYVLVLRFAIAVAVAMSVFVSIDRLFHVLKCFQVRGTTNFSANKKTSSFERRGKACRTFLPTYKEPGRIDRSSSLLAP